MNNYDELQNLTEESPQKPTLICFYIALGALVAAAAAFGCAFIPRAGVYMLIVSILLELAALSFLSAQKKKYNFKGVRIATVAAYVLLAVSFVTFAGGLAYSAVAKK